MESEKECLREKTKDNMSSCVCESYTTTRCVGEPSQLERLYHMFSEAEFQRRGKFAHNGLGNVCEGVTVYEQKHTPEKFSSS